ncbi:hypothetical protein NMY22_g18895 [Coprinellus aureogranulatus]|nr:hypothetical protein NMY22_g18895 [Coprinellus aureogranulatus]
MNFLSRGSCLRAVQNFTRPAVSGSSRAWALPNRSLCLRRAIHETRQKTLLSGPPRHSPLPAWRSRLFGHMARQPDKPEAKKDTPPKLEDKEPTKEEQRRSDWIIIKRLMSNVWPKNDWRTRGTVLFGFVLLVSAKVLNVQVPQLFKSIIDSLNVDITADTTVWLLAGTLIVGYGAARIGATLSGELLNAVFANIGQRAVRKVARETFEHLLSLDLKFHLSRQTGGLTRAIDRGTKGISFLIQAILFRIAPTALEISLVCGILTYKFGWDFAAITVGALALYTWFTVRTTSWRTKFRRDANKADNKAASTAVDSLINFEAVKALRNPWSYPTVCQIQCAPC